MRPHILMADDDKLLLESAVMSLKNEFEISTATSIAAAKGVLAKEAIELAVIDLNFEGQEDDGIALIDSLNKKYPDVPTVVLSADHNTKRVVSATMRDLVGFITKEGDYREDLRIAIRQGLERRRQKLESKSEVEFLTKSSKMKSLLIMADRITANSGNGSILIIGETGTGKEVLAKYIGARLKKHIVAANMASIPKETAESELFGHMAGAFTGAIKNKIGLIEQASSGIFFLDELGECSLDIQAKLLRALEQKEIRPVGGTQSRKVNVQFVAATNKNLKQMVNEGTFREDLYQRLNTFVLNIPSLKERPEDIVLYTSRFIEEFSKEKYFHIEANAFDALQEHGWPGNVRELRNVIERIVTLTTTRTIDRNSVLEALGDQTDEKTINLDQHLSRRDKIKVAAMINALEQENYNRDRAADLLGVHRSTFYRRMERFGIKDIISDPESKKQMIAQKVGR